VIKRIVWEIKTAYHEETLWLAIMWLAGIITPIVKLAAIMWPK